MSRLWVLLFSAVWLLVAPAVAHADAVDDAFAEGTEAASRNDWSTAVARFEAAAALLPQRSAVLSYNLGTAYAHVGDVGRATYHLRRATNDGAGPTAELREAARKNLAAVRRRADLEATTSGAMIDRPQTTWDLLVDGVGAPAVGWGSLICGALFLLALSAHRRWLRHQPRRAGASRVLLLVLGVLYLVPGLLHGWAARSAAAKPPATVLEASVDARDGPGQHRSVEFTLQGGAQVRILERSGGWSQVQLPGGLAGWVPERAIGRLDVARASGPRSAVSP